MAREKTDALSRVSEGRADNLDNRAESAADDAEDFGERLARANEDELEQQRVRAEDAAHKEAEQNRASLRESSQTSGAAFLQSTIPGEEGASTAALRALTIFASLAGACAIIGFIARHRAPQKTIPVGKECDVPQGYSNLEG